jgi:diaminohydroxyphosphoribosylaminopyrimidine deaminase/5-amino-6-(5-phosphoribosylamino)uracil reductase
MKDPNPLVSGRGIRRLRRAGISVEIGVLEEQCRDLNRAFSRHIVSHLPYVHVKVARSIDGKIGGGWISSPASRKLVHEWRAGCDAVLVGAGTVRIDDPLLNVRFVRGRSPDVVILDGRLRVSPTSRLFEMRMERQVILCTTRRAVERNGATFAELKALGVRVLIFRTSSRTIPLRAVCRRLYRLGIGSLLVEGGAEVFGRFLSAGLIDRLSMFTAAEVRGRGVHAFGSLGPLLRRRTRALERTSVQSVGRDVLVDFVFSPEG